MKNDPTASRSSADEAFVERLTDRLQSGDPVDVEGLCIERPEIASVIREICEIYARVARASNVIERADLAECAGDDTAKTDPESRIGTFDEFISTIRKKVGSERYSLRGSIATGGMGAILSVQDEILQRPLAMKVILGQGDADTSGKTPPVDDRTLGRFLDEAQITAQLDHPGIVPIHELGVDANGRVYFTMKLVKGETLADVIDKIHATEDGWTQARALGVLLRVAEAMSYAHEKHVLHRDLKPSNIMVGRFGEVFVMDWGVARVVGEADGRDLRFQNPSEIPLGSAGMGVTTPRREAVEDAPDAPLITMDGEVIGTPAYMSPEQAEGRLEEVGPRSDVYSFGAILYHLVTGHTPYVRPGARLSARAILGMVVRGPPDAIADEAPSTPAMLVAICEKAMCRRAEGRYEDMKELATDLRAFLEGRVVRAYRTGAVAELVLWTRRNRAAAASLALAFLFFAIGLVTSLVLKAQSDKNANRADNNARTAQAQSREALWQSYSANLSAAQSAHKLNEPARMRRALDAAPEEFRNWEWSYLNAASDNSLLTLRHDGAVRSASFSPDGTKVVTASEDSTARIWDATTGNELRRLVGHTGGVHFAAFSPDGSRVITTSRDEMAIIWDVSSGNAIHRMHAVSPDLLEPENGELPSSGVWHAAFTPDGRVVVTVSDDGTVRSWSAGSGTELSRLPWRSEDRELKFGSIAFDKDGSRLLTQSESFARVWDHSTAKLMLDLVGADAIRSAVFSPDGKLVLASCNSVDTSLILWDSTTGSEIRRFSGHRGTVSRASFSFDGSMIVSGSLDSTVRVWDTGTGDEITRMVGHADGVESVAFSPDASRVVSTSQDRTIRVWDSRTGRELARFDGHAEVAEAANFSPDGTRIVSYSEDGSARIWDAKMSATPTRISMRDGDIESIAFSPDGAWIIARFRPYDGENDHSSIWDVTTMTELARVSSPNGYVDSRSEFSVDGHRIHLFDGPMIVFDAYSLEEIERVEGKRKGRAAFLSRDGRSMLSQFTDAEHAIWLSAWETGTLREIICMNAFLARDEASPLSSDGNRMLVENIHGDADAIEVLDLTTGGTMARSAPLDLSVTGGPQFSSCGKMIAVPVANQVRVLTADSCSRITDLEGHAGSVEYVSFAPDTSRIASGSADKTVRLWEPKSGTELLRLDGPTSTVESVAFSPDGTRVMARAGSSFYIWDSTPYRQRHAERRALIAAGPAGARALDAVLEGGTGWSRAGHWLCETTGLEPSVRRAALNELLRRVHAERLRTREQKADSASPGSKRR